MRSARGLRCLTLVLLASCGGAEVRPGGPCMTDTECHGDRICHDGRCRFPEEVRRELGLGGTDAGTPATPGGDADAGSAHPAARAVATFMGDARHTGRSTQPFPAAEPHAAWQVATGGRMPASPVVGADGTVVVGSLDHSVLAVTPTGDVRFRYTAPERVRTTALVTPDGDVVLGADDGSVVALAPDGTLRWRAQLHGAIGFGLARDDDGTLYVPSDGLYALDARGNVKWRVATAGLVTSPPVLHPQGTVLVGTTDGKLLAVRRDGSVAWELATGGAIEGGASVADDGTIVVGNDRGIVLAATPDGREKWRFTCGADVRATPAIAPDGTVVIGSYDQKLHALDPAGHERWHFDTRGRIRSSARIDPNGRIVFGSQDDGLYAVSPDGQLLWRVQVGSDVDSTPAVGDGGTLYVGADDGALRAFR